MNKRIFCLLLVAALCAPNAVTAHPVEHKVYMPLIMRDGGQMIAQYQIITPDGETLNLGDAGYTVGIGDIQDGMGMPPVEHKSWKLFNNPGGQLRSIQAQPRVVTITATLTADCLDRLHDLRNKLFQAVRWNRTDERPPDPAILRYDMRGKQADLYVYYGGDVTARVGNSNTAQIIGVKLIAYDPMWYSTTARTAQLGASDTLSMHYIIAKIAGAWDSMGDNGTGYVFDTALHGGFLYIGGSFLNWAGIANADYFARYELATGTWSACGTPPDASVNALKVAPDGRIILGGEFANAGGAARARLAYFDPLTDIYSDVNGGADDVVYDMAISPSGVLYIVGTFNNVGPGGATAANYIAQLSAAGVWSAVGGGADDTIETVVVAPDNSIYVGGRVHEVGGIGGVWLTVNHVAHWTPGVTTPVEAPGWEAMESGLNDEVATIAIAPSGLVYIGGYFSATTAGLTVNYATVWNGISYSVMSGGVTGGPPFVVVTTIDVLNDGTVLVGGDFDYAGELYTGDGIAAWTGSAWEPYDVNLPGAGGYLYNIDHYGDDVFLATSVTGDARISSPTTNVYTSGDYETFPIVEITGPGTMHTLINETSGDELLFEAWINAGETVTIDLSPGVKSITGTFQGDMLGYASIPSSDFGTWSLRPHPVAPGGNNLVSVYMTETIPVALHDDQGPAGAHQLDDWEDITGWSCDNIAGGTAYVSIIADGGGFFHVAIYSDVARTVLIGHTASYNAAGAQAIVADGGSGLGGTLTVDSATAADANIILYVATICMTYYDRHMSVDHALQ